MTQSADIIIIGAGMAGMGAAAHLSASARVIVLEMEDQPAFHSTGRSVATYIESYGSPVVRSLNKASVSFLNNADPQYWHAPLLKDRGLISFALTGEEHLLDEKVDEGDGVEEVTVAQAIGYLPILRADKISRAVYEAGVKDIDVDAMFSGYRRLMRARDGTIVCGSAVENLKRDGNVWTVRTATETYSAPIVVNAAGAWVDVVGGLAGLKPIGFQPKRRSVATVPVPDAFGSPDGWALGGECKETFYFKPDAGKLLVSPADETPVEPHDAFADDMAIAEGLHRFSEATTVEITRVEHTWGGLRTFSPDKSHVIGFDPRTEGFFWFAGQGGYGIQSSEGGAMTVAGLILNEAVPDHVTAAGLSAADVTPERFLS